MNREYATKIIIKLLEYGVAEFYVCAGARNIPIVEVLLQIEHSKKVVFNHFEERSAAFYALGRIKQIKKPVAIITTSGTAVGELLPAVMEAYHAGLPLVMLTADRPKSQRHCGAPQTTNQKNIFGYFSEDTIDLEVGDEFCLESMKINKPLHINVCFSPPLQRGELKKIHFGEFILLKEDKINSPNINHKNTELSCEKLFKFLKSKNNPLVIISKIPKQPSYSHLIKFIKQLNAPTYIESLSNLRENEDLNFLKIKMPQLLWKNTTEKKLNFDCVLKIGETPTHRIWRDLDEKYTDLPIFSISNLQFSGIPRATHETVSNIDYFFANFNDAFIHNLNSKTYCEEITKFLTADQNSFFRMNEILEQSPHSEQKLFRNISEKIQPNSHVYVGNSSPIRHWDHFCSYENNGFYIEASRGLNGIDGQLSTFFGFANEKAESNWGIFGDLTTLYDMAGPFILAQRKGLIVNICVINNGGGRIFDKVLSGPGADFCQNYHSLNFEYLAKLWGLNYEKTRCLSEIDPISKNSRIIEIMTNHEETRKVDKEILNC